MDNNNSVAVIFFCLNEADLLDGFLDSLAQQTLIAAQVIAIDGGSTDRTLELLKDYSQKLNIQIITLNDRSKSIVFNDCVQKSDCRFLIHANLRLRWRKNYLQLLCKKLDAEQSAPGAGGVLELNQTLTSFQKAAGLALQHQFSIGAWRFNVPKTGKHTRLTISPLYRRKPFLAAGAYREQLLTATETEFQARLTDSKGPLKIIHAATNYYRPEEDWRKFCRHFYEYGRGLGRMAKIDSLPSLRHWQIDRLFTLWTFGLVWNPFGWGLAAVYLLFAVFYGLKELISLNPGWRLAYLFPLMHSACWAGWLKERFRPIN